jgi:hypothetical protein
MEKSIQLSLSENHLQPLYSKNFLNPTDLLTPYMIQKSPLVFYMLEKLITLTYMRKFLFNILNDCLEVDQDPNRIEEEKEEKEEKEEEEEKEVKIINQKRFINTGEMLRNLKELYGIDLTEFSEYWVFYF